MIIAGFPGCGKTSLEKQYPEEFKDHDVSEVKPDNLPPIASTVLDDFCKVIQESLDAGKIVTLLPTVAILDRVILKGWEYVVVRPHRGAKETYLDRYRNRGSEEDFVSLMDKQWDEWMTALDRIDHPTIYLNADQYLSDVVVVEDGKFSGFNPVPMTRSKEKQIQRGW